MDVPERRRIFDGTERMGERQREWKGDGKGGREAEGRKETERVGEGKREWKGDGKKQVQTIRRFFL